MSDREVLFLTQVGNIAGQDWLAHLSGGPQSEVRPWRLIKTGFTCVCIQQDLTQWLIPSLPTAADGLWSCSWPAFFKILPGELDSRLANKSNTMALHPPHQETQQVEKPHP